MKGHRPSWGRGPESSTGLQREAEGRSLQKWSLQGPLARVAAEAGVVSSQNQPDSSSRVQIPDRFWANSFELPY
jgi:hypothetical protein